MQPVNSIIKFVRYVNFDFVNIDLQYRNFYDKTDLINNHNDERIPRANSEDKPNFLKLIKDAKSALDTLGQQNNNKKYEL
jgi:GH18 family chitinase